MAESQGHQAQMAVDSTSTVDGTSEPYEFLSENLRKQQGIIDTNGIRGTRSHASERTRFGNYNVTGTITMNPSVNDLDNWLPRILGAAESTDTFNLAETLPSFSVMIDRVGGVFQYDGCKISRAVFRGSENGFLEMALDIVGKTETTGGTFPSLTLGTTDVEDDPYRFVEGVLTLQSDTREMTGFELVIDNALVAQFNNSETASSIDPTDRIVTLNTTNPFTSDEMADLYGQALAGAAGTLVFTNGNVSTTFTFGTLQVADQSPVVGGKGRIPLNLAMTARKTGATAELVVSSDADASA